MILCTVAIAVTNSSRHFKILRVHVVVEPLRPILQFPEPPFYPVPISESLQYPSIPRSSVHYYDWLTYIHESNRPLTFSTVSSTATSLLALFDGLNNDENL
jgi:hypothetical protein